MGIFGFITGMFAVRVIGGGDDAEAGWMIIARLGRHLC